MDLYTLIMVRKNLERDVGMWNPVLDHPIIRGPIRTDPLEYNRKDNYETNLIKRPKDSKNKKQDLRPRGYRGYE